MYLLLRLNYKRLLQIEGASEVRKMETEIFNKLNKLETTLQRIQAPNMKSREK
jgi:hypothetical protein